MTSVSSNEARNSLGKLLRMASDDGEEIVIKVRGEPTAVLISYTEYEALAELKQLQKRMQALETLRNIHSRVQQRNEDLPDEEAYRMAGFGEEAIREIIEFDQQLAASDS